MYLWLLDEYHNLPTDSPFKQSPKAQYTFVRRAELITAFLMVNNHSNELSVIGGVNVAAASIAASSAINVEGSATVDGATYVLSPFAANGSLVWTTSGTCLTTYKYC